MLKKFERSVVPTFAHHVQIITLGMCGKNVIAGNGFVEIAVGIRDVISMINVVLRNSGATCTSTCTLFDTTTFCLIPEIL